MASASTCSVTALETAHVPAAAATLAEAFSYDSPYSWSRPLGLPQDRFVAWMEHMYLPERAAGEPTSFVADGGAAGVLAMEDLNHKGDDTEETPSPPGMSAIEGILDACKQQFWAALRSRDGDSASGGPASLGVYGYYAFLGVADAARRRGVGAALVQRATDDLRARGFAYGVAFCTSHVSAALFKAQGFERWGGVHYHGFAMPDGSHPFATLPDDECAVMVLDLRTRS